MNIKAKNYIALSLIYAIILAVIVASFLLIPFPKHTVSWIEFGFAIFAILASACSSVLAIANNKHYRGIVYGYPIFKIGIIYAITQFFLTILICALASFLNIPVWACILIGIIPLAVFLILVILAQTARNNVTEIENQGELTTKNATTFNIDVGGLLDICGDPDLRKTIARLLEEFKYSDPVSSEDTQKSTNPCGISAN